MGKINHFLVLVLMASMTVSCEEDVDNGISGDYFFTIINGTSHRCVIDCHPFNQDKEITHNEIQVGDSIVLYTNGGGGLHLENPFSNHQVYLVFDDTLTYCCWANQGHYMLASTENYCATYVSETHTDFRYVITEEDYEYAKAHPYTGEK